MNEEHNPIMYNVKFVKEKDEFVYKDVIILAPGVWADSKTRAPVKYPRNILMKYANNWRNYHVTVNHSRNLDDYIGFVDNIRWSDEKDAVIGDIHILAITEKAKDIIKMIESKKFKIGVSPNLYTKDIWNYEEKCREVRYILFDGVALVPEPACKRSILNDVKY